MRSRCLLRLPMLLMLWAWCGCAYKLMAASPFVITHTTTNSGLSSTTLNGTVNAGGEPTLVAFEYGPTATYGTTVSMGSLSGTTGQSISKALTGLARHTKFHYRIRATNNSGTMLGDDVTFVTANSVPSITLGGATSVTVNEGATFTASGSFADADGDSVTVSSPSFVVTTSGSTWTMSGTPPDGPLGPTTITVAASDAFGGASSTSFALTVANVAPSLTTSGPSVTADAGVITAMTGSAVDPGADTLSYSANWGEAHFTSSRNWAWTGTPSAAEVNTTHSVTVTATDEDGATSTVTFNVIVKDLSLPVFTSVPADKTIAANNLCVASMPDFIAGTVATDNVGVTSLTQSPVAGTSLGIGDSFVKITARDAAGNVREVERKVTVTVVNHPIAATTLAADQLTPTSARLNGLFDPGCQQGGEAHFDYGAPGSSFSIGTQTLFLQGRLASQTSQVITGLQPNTTYRFKASIFVNGTGSNGSDLTFKTPHSVPLIARDGGPSPITW